MSEFTMSRNGSGYYDETAYKAFKDMAKSGEIWTHYAGDREREVLIVKNHDTVCTVLSLIAECKSKNCMEITSRELKYTDPRMLQYVFNESLGNYVKTLPEEEFARVVEEIERALQIDMKKEAKEAKAEEKPVISDGIYKQLYESLIDKLIDKKVM